MTRGQEDCTVAVDVAQATEEYDAPIAIDVEDLMETPEGLVRAGDEFHDPANWRACPRCGVDCPADSTSCFSCGAPFAPATMVGIEPDREVVAVCEYCGHEIRETPEWASVDGHVCEDGFRRHPDGEGIESVEAA